MKIRYIIVSSFFLAAAVLTGCSGGGGGGESTASPASAAVTTGGVLKLGAAGTPDRVAAIDMTINLPAGVSVRADAATGEVAAGAVVAAAPAGGKNLLAAKHIPASDGAPARVRIVTVNAAGFPVGEFGALRFDVAPGAVFPEADAFSVAGFSAIGMDGSTLEAIRAMPLSVDRLGTGAAALQTGLIFTGSQPYLTIDVDSPTNQTSQTVTGTLNPGDTIQVYPPLPATVGPVTITGGVWSAQISGLPMDEDNAILVIEKDPTGNLAASANARITVDTQPPVLTVDASGPSKLISQSISGTSNEFLSGLTVDCPSAHVDIALVTFPRWSVTASQLSSGDNQCTVTGTDLAGNQTTVSGHIYFDNLAPNLDIRVNPLFCRNTVQSVFPTVSGTVEAGTTPAMTLNGEAYPGAMTVTGSNWTCAVTGSDVKEGQNVFSVTATDSAGNVTTRTATTTGISATGSFSGGVPVLADVLKALRIALFLINATPEDLCRGDLFMDGKIDLADAILILKKVIDIPVDPGLPQLF